MCMFFNDINRMLPGQRRHFLLQWVSGYHTQGKHNSHLQDEDGEKESKLDHII